MQSRVMPFVFTCLTVLAFVAAARGEMMLFTPDRDNTLYEHAEDDLSNGSGDYIFMGRTGPNADSVVRRALLHFDVSDIPPEAVIDSAELSLEVNMVPMTPAGGTASLHRVLADWGEGDSDAPEPEGAGTAPQPMDATWSHSYYDTDFWEVPGGDFQIDPSASAAYGTSPGEVITFATTSALERDVRKWISQPDENFGWILIGNEGQDHTARRFDSKDNAGGTPALLTVEYQIEGPTNDLELELLTSDLVRPVVITNAGDGSNRLFIVEQAGFIRIYDLETDTLLPTPFLDISALVDDSGNEQGLLGLAFHPDYEINGQFFVNYTYDTNPPNGPDHTRIERYEVGGNPDIADPTSDFPILEFEQDASNHNGGDMHFDPDGYLVIASGDGGGANDQPNNAQSLDTLLGKMIRIDIDSARSARGISELCGLVQNYAIPPDNPFNGPSDGCDEILHYGMRNPWRFSYDARTGEMYIGDVGQGLWEEIDYAPAGATGINYGWRICEGAHIRGSTTDPCDFGELPIIEYSSGSGSGNCSVTGGYVYRGGNKLLQGRYVYADFCSARIWIATREGDNWVSEEWMESPPLGAISTFGQDEQCELYVADFGSNSVYRIVNSEYLDSSGFEALRCQ